MQRHRRIAAAPQRSASAAWATISQLVTDTLGRSSTVSGSEVAAAMAAAEPAGLMLIAGGHLEQHPVVLVAESLYLSITTVSGSQATTLEENLAAVPGGAGATDWMVYLPAPEPLGETVRDIAMAHPRLSADAPPAAPAEKSAVAPGGIIDLAAFARRTAGS